METVNIHDAKTQFSRLVDAAAKGEEIIIAKAGKPTARLVPMERVKTKRRFGALKGKIRIADDFDGVVPATLEELVTLPGVGRKTANVVLGNAFAIPGVTPDTHLIRVSGRLGWTASSRPDDVERDVASLFPPEDWVMLCHRVIWHGRRCCHARRPACGACPVKELCPSRGIGEQDPELARALIREPRG